jgi:hypothetical protein
MIGFAFAVCEALAKGKTIRSFGFIAHHLASKCDMGDTGWVFDVPPSRRISHQRYDEAYRLAIEAADTFDKCHVPVHRCSLLATFEVEYLAIMIGRYGRGIVVAGLNRVLNGSRRPAANCSVIRWSWFDPEIEAVASEVQARAYHYQPPPRPSKSRKAAA